MSGSRVDRLVDEVGTYPAAMRVLFAIVMAAVGAVLGGCGLAISSNADGWPLQVVAVFCFEPLAVFAFACAVYLAAPGSAAGRWFAKALRRALLVLIVWLVLFLALLGFAVAYLAW